MRVRLAALLVLLTATVALVPGASAYRIEGRAWPGGTIPYFNAAGDQAWAVQQAVNAWNTSGARVRFVAVPQRSAKLVIRSTGRTSCAAAHATVGYVPRATIWIWKQSTSWSRCDPYWATSALTHELGHVLGLGHEDRGCAAMNRSGSRLGPTACERADRWAWRCRLLEHDDVTGAVALYGGSARARTLDPSCELYRPVEAPRDVSARFDAQGTLRVTLRRPASPSLPSFLAASGIAESFVPLWGTGSCPVAFDPTATRYRWDAAPGQLVETGHRVPAGARCLSFWAVDSVGRPSAHPASVRLGG